MKKVYFWRNFYDMINSIIIKYLQDNRRLVIPKLGAFIVKDDSQTVIFSELLRSDDGVLRGLIKAHGVGDIEAAGVIDRFVFEVRHTLDRNMPYKIGNWGTLRRNETGKIIFMSFRTQLQQPTAQQTPRSVFPTPVAQANREVNADNNPAIAEKMQNNEQKRQQARRKKPDLFIVVAIIVAAIAIGAIIYGIFCNKAQEEPMPFPEIDNVEQSFDEEFSTTTTNDTPQNQQN